MDVSTVLPNDNPVYKRTLQLNQYSVNFCYDLCLQKDYINVKCNCSEPSLAPFNESTRICDTIPLLNCSKSVRDQFDSEIDIDDACSKYCPTPCKKEIFNLDTSIADYPTDYYFQILKKSTKIQSKFKSYLKKVNKTSLNDIEPTVLNSILKVNLFYNDLSYVLIADSPAITVDTLIGTIGN